MIDPPAPVTRRHFVQGVAATAALGALASWPARLMAAGGAQSELSGDETLKGNSYAANDFLQSPYEAGKLTRLEDSNYFILELSAK